jgi:hypothetical protein
VVQHGEDLERVVWNTGSTDVHWAAFYSDCVHEIEPLQEGIRVALVYNLVRKRGAVGAPDESSDVARLAGLMEGWGTMPLKLVYLLDHAYTPAERGWNALKGIDQGRAAAVRAAAAREGVDVYLAQLSVEQSWSAESVYFQSSQRSRYMNRVPEEPELYDLIREIRQLHGWIDVNGEPVDMVPLRISDDDDEIVPEGLVDNEPPDEQRYLEATGNEGATVDRTYRRAALVMWPARHRWRMVAARGARGVADELQGMDSEDMVRSLVAAAREEHCLRTWSADVVRVLCSLISTGCVDLVGQVIDEVSCGYLYEMEGIAALIPRMPEELAARLAVKLIRAMPSHRMESVAELLRVCRTSGDERELWAPVVDAATEALSLHSRPPERGLPAIIDAAWYFGHKKLQKYVDKLLADAATADAVATAVVELTMAGIHLPDLGVRVRMWFDDVTAMVPEAPTTWRRAPITTCACSHWEETSRFLTSSTEKKAVYPMRVDLRGHVRSALRRENADVDISEQKTGSPHKLVLKKNSATYERAMARHEARLRLWVVLKAVGG